MTAAKKAMTCAILLRAIVWSKKYWGQPVKKTKRNISSSGVLKRVVAITFDTIIRIK
jgi:hypothetical protein